MGELFITPFMQRALVGGICIGFLASYYGVFVVQRKLSFLGSGLAHAAFGGVALGLFLNTEPLWVAIPFTIVVATGITWVKQNTVLGSDTAIGIFFSVSMALGIVFLFLRRNYSSDAFVYLFGSVLAVSTSDLLITSFIVLISIFTWPTWKRWAYASFDKELAQTDRLPVEKDDYLLTILIAITIVVSIKIVGIVLIAAFLVIPAATARLISGTFQRMTIISVLLGVTTAAFGLIASYYLDIPSGATIILFQAFLFLISIIFRKTWIL